MKEYKIPVINIAVFDSDERILTLSGTVEATDSTTAIHTVIGDAEATLSSAEFKDLFVW